MLNQEPLNETAVLRDYLFALRDGRKPAQRPEISERWLEPVKALEQFYEEAKGSARIMAGSLDILKRFYPELERILAEPSEQAGQEEDLGELAELPAQARLSPDLSRGACRFLELYEQYSKLASPEGFEDAHTMCGFWLLSTVAARRVYLHTGSKFFYTNLLIVVCARTTLFAKTETARVAKLVLQAAGLSFLLAPDKSTPQKFTSDLAGLIVPPDYGELSPKRQEQIKRRLAMAAQRGWFYDEFGMFVKAMLRKNSMLTEFAELFLQLDSCPSTYESTTHVRGLEPIERPYLALLGTMTPANIKEHARTGSEFWSDGFWARFSFVCPQENAFHNHTFQREPLEIPQELVQTLKDWHHRLGEPVVRVEPVRDTQGKETGRYRIEQVISPYEHACTITEEAFEAYRRYREALRQMTAQHRNHDLDGSYGRLPETAMRMALLMASLENDGCIELKQWAKAQEVAEMLRRNLHELYRQINDSGQVTNTARVEEEILRHMERLLLKDPVKYLYVTVNDLHRYMPARARTELDEKMRNLVRIGLLQVEQGSRSARYRLV